jgi:MFS family permease
VAVAVPARGRLSGWFESYRSALASRDLRLLLGGLAVSATGSWAYTVALFAFVFDRTHSVGWVGAAGAVRFVSALAISPYAGVIAERTERIRLMVGADLACALWQAGAAVAAAAGAPVVSVLVLAALTSATGVVESPAVAATIPSVVDEDHLVAANALNGTIDNLVVIAGPAIGAVLLLAASPALVFAINSASFGVAAILVSRITTRTRPVDVSADGSAGPLGQMAVGFRTIASSSAARTLVGLSALVSFVYGTDAVLFVAVSAYRLGTGARGNGYLLAGLGVGGLLMAGAVDRIAGSSKLALIILAGTAGYCLPTALLTVIHDPAVAFAVQIVRGASTLVVDVLAITALQRAVPRDQLARVFGIFFAVVQGSIALGAVVAAPLVTAIGLNGALLTMAFAPTALALLGLPALLALDRRAAATAAALAPRVAILEQLDIFATASRPLLERLAGFETEVEFSAGTAIAREGEAADALYVLVEGEVEVTARGELNAERHIRTMSAPSYFGEIGVLQQIPRTATVTAVGDCRCERIKGESLLDALTSAPASSSLIENVQSRLALTHPSLAPR